MIPEKLRKLLKQFTSSLKACWVQISGYTKKSLTHKKWLINNLLKGTIQLKTRTMSMLFYILLWIKRFIVDGPLWIYFTLIERPILWVYFNILWQAPTWIYFFWRFIWRKRFVIRRFLFRIFVFFVIILNIAVNFAPEATYNFFLGFF